MGTTWKVLAVLNALAVVGFLCLAASDHARRRAWTFAVQQEDFAINGLPVDDKEKNAEGERLVDLLGNRMAQQLFSGAGEPVKTQVDEVNKRKDSLLRAIDAAEGEQGKRQLILQIILPLGRNAVERESLRHLVATAKAEDLGRDGPILGGDGLFENAFKDALQERAYDEKRQVIAHVLFATSLNQQDYQRTLAVVGLNAYTREVEGQAAAYKKMIPEVELALDNDRKAFAEEHQALIQRIIVLADRLHGLQEDLQKQQTQLAEYTALVESRRKNKENLLQEIKATQEATRRALAEQSDLEKQLLAAQQMVAKTNENNQRLQQEISKREQAR